MSAGARRVAPRVRVVRALLLSGHVWLLSLACGHRAARPQIRNVFVGELPAPKHVECADCARGGAAWGATAR